MTIIHFTIPSKGQDEDARLEVVGRYPLELIGDDPELNAIVGQAAAEFGAPIVLVSIVQHEQQCFPACVGLDVASTPRSISFCGHAILGSETMVVPDARLDARFAGNPLVIGPPHLRFYAGARLIAPEGLAIGTLCVIDTSRRDAAAFDLARLEAFAEAVMTRLGHLREDQA
jgi:GAF domain-containing protein